MFENLARFSSLESNGLIASPGRVDEYGSNSRSDVSAGTQIMLYGDVARAVITAIGNYFRNKGLDKETIQVKINDFVDLLKNNHDISDECASWLNHIDIMGDCDYYDNYKSCIPAPADCGSLWTILCAARSTLGFSADWCSSIRSKFSPKEKEMFEELQEARRRFWEARDKVETYLYDQALMTVDLFMTKYADVLQKLAKEWFEDISESLKREVTRLKKRQAEKTAEKTNTVTKAVNSDTTTDGYSDGDLL